MAMTWKEFKRYVDREMEKQDIPQDVEIDYIDVSSMTFVYADGKPEVAIDEYGLSIY